MPTFYIKVVSHDWFETWRKDDNNQQILGSSNTLEGELQRAVGWAGKPLFIKLETID
jgi:hypothetical protein